jgi:glycosyltransferase involved in cell wall biosynthesis
MTKSRIAVLIDWYLPGTSAGGPVRSVYSLVNLLKDYFDFYIITSNHDLGSNEPYKDVEHDQIFLNKDIHYYYFSPPRLTQKNMCALLKEINPHVVYLNSFWSYPFSIGVVRLKNSGALKAPVLLAPRGMLGSGALKIKPFKKKVFLTLARLANLYRHVHFHATQSHEKQDIERQLGPLPVSIAPNLNSTQPVKNKSVKKINTLKLFYLSRISPVKNLHFALKVLHQIPPQYEVQYDIFGNLEDLDYWNDCLKSISTLPGNVTVQHKGTLEFDKIRETISDYHCLFIPTFNENYGHSIVESLLCGCPAIISDQTPWNDLEAAGAGYAFTLREKKSFVNAIISFAQMSQEEFMERSEAAGRYIAGKTDPGQNIMQYKNLFNERIKN